MIEIIDPIIEYAIYTIAKYPIAITITIGLLTITGKALKNLLNQV